MKIPSSLAGMSACVHRREWCYAPEWARWLSELWWVLRLALWLGVLPLRLRRYALPRLLERLTPVGRCNHGTPLQMEHMVRLIVRLCHLRVFRTRLFPRTCLRQALTLYYGLTRLGHPVTLHIGVSKAGATLHAHSWVTVADQAVGERAPLARFQVIYAYPQRSSGPHETSHDDAQRNGQRDHSSQHTLLRDHVRKGDSYES